MRILLIGLEDIVAGIGVRYLSAYLKSQGHEPYILFSPKSRPSVGRPNEESEPELETIRDFAYELAPDAIGISLMTHHFYRAVALSETFRTRLDVPVVWGGAHPTYVGEECAAHADYIAIGEAESSLAEFMDRLSRGDGISETAGFGYAKDGELAINPQTKTITNLDDIPLIDLNEETIFVLDEGDVKNLNAGLYRKYSSWKGTWYRLTTTRGCPYKCAYCPGGIRRRIDRRSVTNVMKEIEKVVEQYPFTTVLNVQDDSFFIGDDDWLGDFSVRLKSDFGLKFMCRLMPKYVTDERISTLYEGGLRYISMGLQTGSRRVNYDIYNRRETAEDFLEAERIIRKFDIQKVYDVIFDNPYETEAESLETIRTIAQCKKPFLVYGYSLTPYPGTVFYDKARKDGWLKKMTDPYESPFLVTDENKYRSPPYLRELLSISMITPRGIVIFLADRSRKPWALFAIKILHGVYKIAMKTAILMRARSPRLLTKVLSLVRNSLSLKPPSATDC
ncbi:MAG: B12-binding domain-containing radical SAM protein [Candidatus Coatesbacteria bacterium]|nr:MAG: B12-binding domain-containing radical SAM protein [Candidatus Coatesbacteria bacterium]